MFNYELLFFVVFFCLWFFGFSVIYLKTFSPLKTVFNYSNNKEGSWFEAQFFFIAFLFVLFLSYYWDFYSESLYCQYCMEFGFALHADIVKFTYFIGVDGLSALFLFLTLLLVFICFLFVEGESNVRDYQLKLWLINICLIFIFTTLNFFVFFIFFEAILIPMFLLIGIFGSRARKIRAVYLFFFYTLGSSTLMLLSLIYIYISVGSFDIDYLYSWSFTASEQNILWWTFFLAFAAKIPLFPLHLWLPEAHVEAPTVGSVLLAGILLKLGIYGLLRFNLILFPDASWYFCPLIFVCSVLGIINASFTAIRQTDLKRIIAYSSVAHMNIIALGIFCGNTFGFGGAIFQSLSHGFVSGGLFFLIGILYNKYHSRFLYYYGGLTQTMPLFSILWLLFTLANIAVPMTSSFIGEFFLLLGIFNFNFWGCLLSALGVILCGTYSLWLSNRLLFGNYKIEYIQPVTDVSEKEFLILLPLLIFILLLGIYPTIFLSQIKTVAYCAF